MLIRAIGPTAIIIDSVTTAGVTLVIAIAIVVGIERSIILVEEQGLAASICILDMWRWSRREWVRL